MTGNVRRVDWNGRQSQFVKDSTLHQRAKFAAELHVERSALESLRIGWCERLGAYTFPERDHRRNIVGILRRDAETDEKRMSKGGKRGIYLCRDWQRYRGPIFIPEGVTDTAALLSEGLCAIGRPNAKGGIKYLVELLRDVDREIIVLGENDRKLDGHWPGRDGAKYVAGKLATELQREINWALPPKGNKDARQYFFPKGSS